MGRFIWITGTLLLLVTSVSAPAHADKRVALVVGNSAYKSVSPLDNPKNDAKLMADTLKTLGFTLIGNGAQVNMDKGKFDIAVQNFGKQIQGADVALFYYAGHGVQVSGSNYLVPVDANPTREADVDFQMVDVNLVLRQMQAAATKLNLVILDACRNNPFGGRGLRAADGGLAQMRAPEGTLISYATQPGNVAQDGADGNSPYTKALTQTITLPGLDIFRTFNQVGLAVKLATGGSQQPWVSLSPISGDFYFAAGQAAAAPPPASAAAPVPSEAERAWATVQNATNTAVLEAFIRRFGNTFYADLARARLDELKKTQVAVVAPPVQPTPPSALVQPAVVVPPSRPGAPCGTPSAAQVAVSSRSAQPLSSAEECALQPKDSFKECDTCPEMVVVPPGSFTMGSPQSETDRQDDEGPQHLVGFKRQFAVGKFEVTIDQFAAFTKETGYDAGSKCWTLEDGTTEERIGRSWRNPGYAQDASHPAACLNWNDAKAYLGWLAKKTGKDYRLLTEAEWEYATRARTTPGSAPRYFFGDDETLMCGYGNGADQTAKKIFPVSAVPFFPCSDGYAYTSPVGSFMPNGFGLYDMHGNVGEWTEDCYNDNYEGASVDGSAWTSGACDRRVVRGGDWALDPGSLRAAMRDSYATDLRNHEDGFRVARTLLTP